MVLSSRCLCMMVSFPSDRLVWFGRERADPDRGALLGSHQKNSWHQSSAKQTGSLRRASTNKSFISHLAQSFQC